MSSSYKSYLARKKETKALQTTKKPQTTRIKLKAPSSTELASPKKNPLRKQPTTSFQTSTAKLKKPQKAKQEETKSEPPSKFLSKKEASAVQKNTGDSLPELNQNSCEDAFSLSLYSVSTNQSTEIFQSIPVFKNFAVLKKLPITPLRVQNTIVSHQVLEPPSVEVYSAFHKLKPFSCLTIPRVPIVQLGTMSKSKEKLLKTKAVLKIQAFVKGWLQRIKFKKYTESFKEDLKYLKLQKVEEKIKKSIATYKAYRALKKWYVCVQKEKKEMFEAYVNYSASYIQKVWRGYKARKRVSGKLKKRLCAKSKIGALAIGWKTRRILKTKYMMNQVKETKDMELLKKDLEKSKDNSVLLKQLKYQLPAAKRKFVADFYKYYIRGRWLQLVTKHTFSPESSFGRSNSSTAHSTLEKPLNELQKATQKTQKAPPKEVQKALQETQLETPEEKDTSFPKAPPKTYLKRRTQHVKPQKLEWKAQSRIDCWNPRTSPKSDQTKNSKTHLLNKIEAVFSQLKSSHCSSSEFFSKRKNFTAIPQLSSKSKFILKVSESHNYNDVRMLENYYKVLCED